MDILKYLLNSTHINNQKVYTSNIVFYGKEFKDDNIFFTALIAYTLKSIKETFSDEDQNIIEKIIQNCQYAFAFYKNKHGDITYNFYPTQPLNQYSGIKFLNKFTALHIPDDLDTTSLVYLSQNRDSKQIVHQLKKKYDSLSNDGKPLKSIPKSYQKTKAYRTWFATKMNHDMDICVVCNVLCLMFQNQIPFTETDIDSINLISELIATNKFIRQAYLFAPHYKTKSIIIYHIVRLLHVTQIPQIVKHKQQLINQCKSLLKTKINPLEKVILITSLYKLGSKLEFTIKINSSDFKNFYWFKANPFSISAPWIKTLLSQKKFLHLEYSCAVYYYTLILELKQISNATISHRRHTICIKNNANTVSSYSNYD
ncbi:hypothetical protein ACXGQW_10895 [Wenyingzhuangia sp. IMCC45533]